MCVPKRELYQSLSRRMRQCRRMILGALFWGWFKAKTKEQREWRYPEGPSEVNIAGSDPARILIMVTALRQVSACGRTNWESLGIWTDTSPESSSAALW
jgi:hypothetical protein